MRYQRNVAGARSVVKAGAAYWAKIAAATGINASAPPDCAAGYLKAKNEMAKERCEADRDASPGGIADALKELDRQGWNDAPSVVEYEAQTVLAAGHATTTTLSRRRSVRHPAD